MRLKGGKLLLDLSNYNLTEEPTIQLTKEQVDCILSKGLTIKIRDISNGNLFVTDLIITTITNYNTIAFNTLFYSGEMACTINLETNELMFVYN